MKRDFADGMEEFYNSHQAELLSRAYAAQALQDLARGNEPVLIGIGRPILDNIVEHLEILQRYYRQKLIPRERIRRLDELLKQLRRM